MKMVFKFTSIILFAISLNSCAQETKGDEEVETEEVETEEVETEEVETEEQNNVLLVEGIVELSTFPAANSEKDYDCNVISSGNPNACKKTCEVGECGPVSDGCGNLIECGSCTLPEICGGAGIPSRCGVPTVPNTCTPTTCEALGATCGLQSDSCGGILDCWSAAAKASGATPACEVAGYQCINGTCKSTVPECTKLTCNDYARNAELCGPVSDGCSGVLDCGFTCAATHLLSSQRSVAACTPLTCEQALVSVPDGSCDVVADGCGGIIPNCHKTTCTGAETCGGAGEAGVCGVGTVSCTPHTPEACGSICGKIPDGCGGEVTCPTACIG